MNEKVDINAAETRLTELIDRVVAGEEIIISRCDRPVARLVPIFRPDVKRTPGRMRGRIRIAARFDDALPSDLF